MLYLGETQTLGGVQQSSPRVFQHQHHDRLSNASPTTFYYPPSLHLTLDTFSQLAHTDVSISLVWSHRKKESCLLLFRKPVLAASSDHESSQPAPLGFSWLWQEFPTKSSCFSILLDKTLTSTSNCPSYCCAPTCATQTTSQPVLQVYQALDSQVLLTVPPSSRP